MTKTICIVYAPGAYGSFLGWAIDRFNTKRVLYEPKVLDDPILPDGSSHSYASFCKVKHTETFISELEKCRSQSPHWGYGIYGGWPANIGENIDAAIHQIYLWMNREDKIIFVERPTLQEVFLCWLNNETKMTRERWYGILNIENDDMLTQRLLEEIRTKNLNDSYDNRLLRISVNDILYNNANNTLKLLHDHVGFDVCDSEIFVNMHSKMLSLQDNIMTLDSLLKSKIPLTPAQKSITNYIKENKNGFY